MKIIIDDTSIETNERSRISISMGVATVNSPDKSRVGYSKSINIPMSDLNRRVMGDADQIAIAEQFNHKSHTARIEKNGATVLEGVPQLISSTKNRADGEYQLAIIGAGKNWANRAAKTPIRALDVEYSRVITELSLLQGWTNDDPVKFLPVQREGFEVENITNNIFSPVKALAFEDYHPFLHLKTIIQAIFQEAGYSVDSRFIDSPYFDTLYISGNYPKKETSAIKKRMDFRAGRFGDALTVADAYGRVFASPLDSSNSIGNIVDSADPNEEQNGKTVEGVYSNGGLFQKDGRRVVFKPYSEVSIAFEYGLFYKTDYYIKNRNELKGVDKIYLGAGGNRTLRLTNRFADRRDEFRGLKSYTIVIFDHSGSDKYRIEYKDINNPTADIDNLTPTDYTIQTSSVISTRSSRMAISTSNRVAEPVMTVSKNDGLFTPYSGDWALYDGYVEERGEVEVEAVIRSSAEKITPGSPKYFDLIYFSGAEAGMNFTLRKESYVRPVFAEYIAEGSTVRFKDVAAHQFSCLDLLNAVKHLFNLHFYTNEETKRVNIEPRNIFYDSSEIVDWSDRLDHGKPIKVSEIGAGMAQRQTFSYKSGDGSIRDWNVSNGEVIDKWSAELENSFSVESETTYENPLFTPSINLSGSFPSAQSASLLQVGDRGTGAAERDENLNFLPKIVHYLGMRTLPSGQQWGFPSNDAKYPLVVFHHQVDGGSAAVDPSEDFERADRDTLFKEGANLFFGDREGDVGLHRFYDDNISLYNRGKRVEAYIDLSAEEVEAIVYPNRLKRDLRALYMLKIDGESALYRLEQVCDYAPGGEQSTKCIFIKEV